MDIYNADLIARSNGEMTTEDYKNYEIARAVIKMFKKEICDKCCCKKEQK